jgi:hypothetical protein
VGLLASQHIFIHAIGAEDIAESNCGQSFCSISARGVRNKPTAAVKCAQNKILSNN